MPPAKKTASRRRTATRDPSSNRDPKASAAKEPAALRRLNKSLDGAQDALAALRKDVSRDVSARGVHKDVEKVVKDARQGASSAPPCSEADRAQSATSPAQASRSGQPQGLARRHRVARPTAARPRARPRRGKASARKASGTAKTRRRPPRLTHGLRRARHGAPRGHRAHRPRDAGPATPPLLALRPSPPGDGTATRRRSAPGPRPRAQPARPRGRTDGPHPSPATATAGERRRACRCPSGSAPPSAACSMRRDSAAVTGSRWPGPSRGPQPQTGSSARSRPSPIARHLVEQLGVAREVDASAALDHVAERTRPARRRGDRPRPWRAGTAATRRPPTDMPSPSLELDHLVKARVVRGNAADPAGATIGVPDREPPQGAEVQVVVVEVRDQDRVGPRAAPQRPREGAAAQEPEQVAAQAADR